MTEIIPISTLTELTSITPGNEYWIPIVDESEVVDANKTKRISPENLASDIATILAAVYPVGSIFITTVATNPATLFGFGTWAAFATGRAIVGIDTGQTEFNTVEKTGGAKTHTLTTAEMPAHTHSYTAPNFWAADNANGSGSTYQGESAGSTSGSAGGGGAHNNLQPYITAYIWKRTA